MTDQYRPRHPARIWVILLLAIASLLVWLPNPSHDHGPAAAQEVTATPSPTLDATETPATSATDLPTGTAPAPATEAASAPATDTPTTTPALAGEATSTPTTASATGVRLPFSDGFESGTLSQWPVVTGVAVQQGDAFSGVYAARAQADGSATYLRALLASPQEDIYLRVRFKIVAQDSSTFHLLSVRSAADAPLIGVYLSSSGELGIRNHLTGVATTSTALVSSGAWHELQLHVVTGSAGSSEVWLDGVAIGSLTQSQPLAGTPVGVIQLGEDGTGSRSTVLFDDVAADTTLIAGGPVPPVPASTATTTPESAAAASVAELMLSKTKSKYNGVVVATLIDFSPRSPVTLTWPDGLVLGETTTDGGGNGSISFRTPLYPLGSYRLTARDSAGNTAQATLRVIPRIKLTQSSGPAGTTIRVYCYGFAPGDRIAIQWYELNGSTFTVLKTITAADNGRATSLVTIPSNAPAGSHTVRAKVVGVSRSTSTTFNVTGPSPTPTPTATATPPVGSVTLMAAGDIVCGKATVEGWCVQAQTANLILSHNPDAVLALGDVQYECAELDDFINYFDPTWGRFKGKIYPTTGNHEYKTGSPCVTATGDGRDYFRYFGAVAGDPSKGYYSFDLGAWHIVALNSNCSKVGGCAAGSPQEAWLRADLEAHPTSCTLAFMHFPRYSTVAPYSSLTDLWQALYDYDAEVVLAAHDHHYARFGPRNATGGTDSARGIVQFIVGTGGKQPNQSFGSLDSPSAKGSVPGVLKLTLSSRSFSWQFVPVPGYSYSDSGSRSCHDPSADGQSISSLASSGQDPLAAPGSIVMGPASRAERSEGRGVFLVDGFATGQLIVWTGVGVPGLLVFGRGVRGTSRRCPAA